MARGGKQPTNGDLHYPTGRDVYLPCAGRNQQGRLERARLGVTCRNPASVVEYVVVPCAMRSRFPGSVLASLSSPYPASAASGNETSGCYRNDADICLDGLTKWLRGLRQSPLAAIHRFVY